MKRSLVMCLIVVLGGALLIYQMEGHAQPVGNGWDSIWWSFSTTVTGGFGDIHNPESGAGRALTVLLVIVGMILVGIFTATLTTILMPEQDSSYNAEKHEQFQADVTDKLKAHEKRQSELLCELRAVKYAIGFSAECEEQELAIQLTTACH